MKAIYLFILMTVAVAAYGQEAGKYEHKGQSHLIGVFDPDILRSDPAFSEWFMASYHEVEFPKNSAKWKKDLKTVKVEIYMGTWCGDSRYLVPKFIKLWEELGLKKDQLQFVALYGGGEHYKQSPEGQEIGKHIHRVPTFIFTQNDQEIARIVENPVTDLYTDIAQIALGYPAAPQYEAANYLYEQLELYGAESLESEFSQHLNQVGRKAQRSYELNTLGYVLMAADKLEEARLIFKMNTALFKYEPNVYDSYAECLARMGQSEQAVNQYQKVLDLDPDNENAKKMLEKIANR